MADDDDQSTKTVTGPEGELRKRMMEMFEDSEFSDLTVTVVGINGGESQNFALHRCILTHSSVYFRGMLTRDFKEAEQEKVKVQVAPGSSVAATGQVLRYLYTSEIDIDGNSVLEILAAADLIQVDSLRAACVDFLDNSLCNGNACTIWKASRNLELTILDGKAKEFIFEHAEKVLTAGGFDELPKAMVVSLLADEKLNAKEESLFEAVVTWGESNKGSGTVCDAVADLLPHLRFDEMPHAFLHQRVRQSGLVSDAVLFDAALAILDEKTDKYEPGTKRAFDDQGGSSSGAGSGRAKKRRRIG